MRFALVLGACFEMSCMAGAQGLELDPPSLPARLAPNLADPASLPAPLAPKPADPPSLPPLPAPNPATSSVDPVVSSKVLAFSIPVRAHADDSELTKKLKERHNSAVALLDERLKEYKRGVRDANFVFEAVRLAAEAKLDLASDAAARREVLEQTLEVAKLAEAHLERQLAKGFGSKADLERARYGRLSVEVELLRLKRKN